MSSEFTGFDEFYKSEKELNIAFDKAITQALEETCEVIKNVASDLSPVLTGTLRKSWEVDDDSTKVTTKGDYTTYEMVVHSAPKIIATNPLHPNGEYYSSAIEDGFTLPSGKWYPGHHMLETGITYGSSVIRNLILINIMEKLK